LIAPATTDAFALTLHVIGAALILAGTWYHRPITQSWVYAAVGIWVAADPVPIAVRVPVRQA
jgi:hypothetical protein